MKSLVERVINFLDKCYPRDSTEQLLSQAMAELRRLQAEGWTKDDFARALEELLEGPKP